MKLTEGIIKEKNLIGKNGHCTVPDCYTEIGWWAFENCTNLKVINLPDSIAKIEVGIFYNCTSLKSIELPNSIIEIRRCAFDGCTSLKLMTIPENIKTIGYDVFSGCTNLPKLGVGKEILEIALKDNYFEQHNGLCICFRQIVSELILKYRKPICLEVELPMFTVENAILHANGRNKDNWFKDRSDRKKFLEWMLSEISKNDFNDEILILRR